MSLESSKQIRVISTEAILTVDTHVMATKSFKENHYLKAKWRNL